jgi:hypothetical protein
MRWHGLVVDERKTMNGISITRLGIKNKGFGTRAVLFEYKHILLMEYKEVEYGALNWVCVDIVLAEGFDWEAWLENGNAS